MKIKKFIVLLLVALLLIIAKVAYADYGIPGTVQYEAVVTNEDGATVSEDIYSNYTLSVIPYGATVTVDYEYNGELYVIYNEEGYMISKDDVKPASDATELLEETEENYKNMYVWREGAYLYKGPATSYGKLDSNIEIPVGTLIKVRECSDTWGYVEYDGYEGWIFIYTSDEVSGYDIKASVADIEIDYKYAYYYTGKEITLESSPGAGDSVGTIPAGVQIHSYFYVNYPDPHYHTIYTKYNDVEGWYTISYDDEIYYDFSMLDENVFVLSGTEYYSDIELDDDGYTINLLNKIGTISEGTECSLVYMTISQYDGSVYCIEYNGERVWVNTCSTERDEKIRLTQNIKKIDIDAGEELDEEFVAGTEATYKYWVEIAEYVGSTRKSSTYYYIETEDDAGWVILDSDENYEEIEEEVTEDETSYEYLVANYMDVSQFVIKDATNPESSEVVDPDESDERSESNKNNDEESSENVFEDYLLYCVIGAVIIFVLVIIIIVAINKGKNKKKDKGENQNKIEGKGSDKE